MASLLHRPRRLRDRILRSKAWMLARRARWWLDREIRPGPREYQPVRLLPVWLVLPIALAVAAAGARLVSEWVRSQPHLVGHEPDPLEVTKVVLAIIAGLGAVFVGVYSYRKQRLEENASSRADADQFLAQYNAAVEQLAHDKPAARLAGAYSMARLADGWPTRRQSCVDVLCAYLRMSGDGKEDREVRGTIVRLIAEHLADTESPQSWSPLNFDLQGAHLVNANFSDAHFFERADFSRATFTDDAYFSNAQFFGLAIFTRATFTDNAHFDGVHFNSIAAFDATTFGDREAEPWDVPMVDFHGAAFHGGITTFLAASFHGTVAFEATTFETPAIDFHGARFQHDASFASAVFDGGVVDFDGARVCGRLVFDGVSGSAHIRTAGIDAESEARITKDGAPFDGSDGR